MQVLVQWVPMLLVAQNPLGLLVTVALQLVAPRQQPLTLQAHTQPLTAAAYLTSIGAACWACRVRQRAPHHPPPPPT